MCIGLGRHFGESWISVGQHAFPRTGRGIQQFCLGSTRGGPFLTTGQTENANCYTLHSTANEI